MVRSIVRHSGEFPCPIHSSSSTNRDDGIFQVVVLDISAVSVFLKNRAEIYCITFRVLNEVLQIKLILNVLLERGLF